MALFWYLGLACSHRRWYNELAMLENNYLSVSNFLYDLGSITRVLSYCLVQHRNSIYLYLVFILLDRFYCSLCPYVCRVFVDRGLGLWCLCNFSWIILQAPPKCGVVCSRSCVFAFILTWSAQQPGQLVFFIFLWRFYRRHWLWAFWRQ